MADLENRQGPLLFEGGDAANLGRFLLIGDIVISRQPDSLNIDVQGLITARQGRLGSDWFAADRSERPFSRQFLYRSHSEISGQWVVARLQESNGGSAQADCGIGALQTERRMTRGITFVGPRQWSDGDRLERFRPSFDDLEASLKLRPVTKHVALELWLVLASLIFLSLIGAVALFNY